MGESYIDEPDKWRKIHIPLTPYWLCRHPETRLWHVAEKELTVAWHGPFSDNDYTLKHPYLYRLL